MHLSPNNVTTQILQNLYNFVFSVDPPYQGPPYVHQRRFKPISPRFVCQNNEFISQIPSFTPSSDIKVHRSESVPNNLQQCKLS